MNIKLVNDYATKVLLEQIPKEQQKIKLEFFTHLINNGLVDYQRLFKGCVNHYYDKQYKENGCVSGVTVIDTSLEFECSTRTIYTVIYKFKNVRLDF